MRIPASNNVAGRIDQTAHASTREAKGFPGAPASTDAVEVISPLVETADLARIFRRSDRTIRRWIAAGHLKPIKIGGAVFFHPADVQALLARHMRP
ncbi:helix-turn-helix domain-containing protein [Acidiphilium sp. JA12-A1]|uniref:helix-turn-helix domain-containing protein n=1 Tax=Acidiphilium sp. JA12-A1 TaxID=1464546 RepID=UPI0038CD96C6